MDIPELAKRHCTPCHTGIGALDDTACQTLLKSLSPDWRIDTGRLCRQMRFHDFTETIAHVNRIAAVAEREDHHPDLAIHYNTLDISLWTHSINGLSENDFILASQIDQLSAT